jgi:hypothetical protein
VSEAARRTASFQDASYSLVVHNDERGAAGASLHRGPGAQSALLEVIGEVATSAGRSRLTMRQWPNVDQPVEVIVDGNVMYLRSDPLARITGVGDNWLRVDVDELPSAMSGAPADPTPSVITGLLTLVAGGTEARRVDAVEQHERNLELWWVRASSPDPGATADGDPDGESLRAGGFVGIDPWLVVGVDGAGYVRLVEATMTATGMVMRFDLLEPGGGISIEVPANSVTVDDADLPAGLVDTVGVP